MYVLRYKSCSVQSLFTYFQVIPSETFGKRIWVKVEAKIQPFVKFGKYIPVLSERQRWPSPMAILRIPLITFSRFLCRKVGSCRSPCCATFNWEKWCPTGSLISCQSQLWGANAGRTADKGPGRSVSSVFTVRSVTILLITDFIVKAQILLRFKIWKVFCLSAKLKIPLWYISNGLYLKNMYQPSWYI